MGITEILTAPDDIRLAIRTTIASSESSSIAVPYWGGRVVQALGLEGNLKGRVQILCNLPSGSCDPVIINDLMARGASVRSLSSLHAKAYIGSELAVVGSANASTEGLGLRRDAGWNEACVAVTSRTSLAELDRWFATLWHDAADLSDRRVARLLLESAALRYNRRNDGEAIDLLETLRNYPEDLRNAKLFVTLDWVSYGRNVEKDVDALREKLGEDIDAWEDWEEMPADAQILSFHYDARAKVKYSYEGTWQTPSDPLATMDCRTKAIYVYAVQRILGRYRLGDENVWLEAIARFQRDLYTRRPRSDKDAIMHVVDFARTYLVNER